MSLDLKKLENKLDEALSNETSETLNKFLDDKRMTNNKQLTSVEWFIEELEYKGDLRETPSIRNIQLNIDTSDYMELKVQAQEMEKEQRSIELPTDEEIWKWWQTQKFQKEQGEQEYTMLYEIDLPKILKAFIENFNKIQGGNNE
jgi:hypothetical protein